MARKGRTDDSREPGGYCALPWCVIDSQAFQSLSYPAVALLIELARQYVRNNNGKLLLSGRYLATRGWRSKDVIERARRELLDVKLIYQTVQGHRPNKASWYAVTWYTLDRLPGYDAGAVEGFRRGMYASFQLPTPASTREALFEKWRGHGKTAAPKIDRLSPAGGVKRAATAPAGGVESLSTTPANGAIRALLPSRSTPSNGHHLDKPFCTGESLAAGFGGSVSKPPVTTAANSDNDHAGHFERVRERELDPTRFDPTTGEFCPPPPAPARKQKNAADQWVKTALASR